MKETTRKNVSTGIYVRVVTCQKNQARIKLISVTYNDSLYHQKRQAYCLPLMRFM